MMNNDQNNTNPADMNAQDLGPQNIHSDELNFAQLCRASADGELSPQQEAELKIQAEYSTESNPTARVAFESTLKQSCAKAMTAGTAMPEEAKAKVLAALAGAAVGEDRAAIVEPTGTLAGNTASKSFWQRVALPLAAAASLAIAAVVVFTQPGKSPEQDGAIAQYDDTPMTQVHPRVFVTQGEQPPRLDVVEQQRLVRLVSFTNTMHNKCEMGTSYFDNKFVARTQAEAESAAIELLDGVPSLVELNLNGLADLGYTFHGLGKCGVPGDGKSVHLLYASEDRPELGHVSLFIQEDGNTDSALKKIDAGHTYFVSGGPCPKGNDVRVGVCANKSSCKLVMWRESGFVYYLFAPTAQTVDEAADQLAPQRTPVII